MWLRKNKENYISILVNSQRISWFCFEKTPKGFVFKYVDQAVPAEIGFVDYYLCNPSFFVDWLSDLLQQHKIKKPLVAIGGLFLPIILFQYELLLSQVGIPMFFVDSNKLHRKVLKLVENLSGISVKEADLEKAISLWGVLDESR